MSTLKFCYNKTMKNTYLIAILFLVVGLVAGQFLNLNIANQESAVLKASIQKDNTTENLKSFTDFKVIEIPSGEREYACWSSAGGPIFISTGGDDSGSISYGGLIWSCYAISYNWA